MGYFKGTLMKKILGKRKREIDMTQDDPQADPDGDDPQADPNGDYPQADPNGESSQKMTRKKYAAAFGFSEDLLEEEDLPEEEDDSISKYEALFGSSGSEDSYLKEPSLKKGRREIYVEDSSDDSIPEEDRIGDFSEEDQIESDDDSTLDEYRALLGSDDDSRYEALEEIIHPPFSNNKYRSFVLDNGLSVLLVSSPESHQAAAAIAVRCGSFDDPPDIQGLAHLFEHLLFLGSKKYPGANEFKDFVHGDVNAKTELDYSVFSMRAVPDQFEVALKMFADMFIDPLMDFERMKMELTTIDSEFELRKFKDSVRQEELFCHTASKSHPFHRFTWGNKDSLSRCDHQSLHSRVKKLFHDYYIASNMKLVITTPDNLDDLKQLVRLYFMALNHTELNEGIGRPPIFMQTKEIWATDVCYVVESLEDAQSIQLSWVLPPTHMSSRPEILIQNLLGQENEGSLCFLLKSKGWVTKFTASVGNNTSFVSDDSTWSYSSTSAGQIFVIVSDLTNTGWEKRYDLVGYVFQYLNRLRVQRPSQPLMNEYTNSLRMKYYGLEYVLGDPLFFAEGLAVNMLKGPTTHALSMDFLYGFGDQAEVEEILKILTPQNMRVDAFSKAFTDEVFQIVPFFDAKYKREIIPAHYIDTWQTKDIDGDSSLFLPSLNQFMPLRFFEEIERVSSINEEDDTHFEICLNEVSTKLFHRELRSGLLSYASFNLYTNVGSDIKAQMSTLIIIEMIKEDLSVILFKGKEAFINCSLAFGDNMILELRVDGFHEKFKDFISEIWKRIKSFIPKEGCFKIIMDKLQSEFTSRDIVQQAFQLLSNVLIEDNISLDEKFKVLKNISFADVKHYNLFSEIRIVGVCSGKLSREESEEIISIFEAIGDFEIPNELRKKKVLTPGIPLQINAKPKTESETNSLAKVFFQMSCKEDDSGREIAFLVILNATIEEYLYTKLRLEERLGYDIGCGIHLDSGMRGLFVYVVSPIHQPDYLLERIYTFIGTVGEFLEGVDESSFESYRNRAYDLLPDSAGICHELIHDISCIEGRLKSAISSLEKMKKEEVIDLLKEFFAKESCCSIDICICAAGYNSGSYAPNGSGGKYQNHKEEASSTTVTIGVSDEHIGLVIGRGGKNMREIAKMTGARIKISDRGDFMSGTTNRKVSITGSQRAIQQAETMIKQKVESATERATD